MIWKDIKWQKKQSTVDFFMQNANEANRPVAPYMANNISNLQDEQACLCENISNDQELCIEQSG